MLIFSIETSCDETSMAITRGREVIWNSTISQIEDHKKHGGVIPSLAAKLHLKNLREVFTSVLENSMIPIDEIDLVAYTENPGLAICLQVGKIVAETISLFTGKPLLPCNHLEGHICSSLINNSENWEFPALAIVLSGGHTQIYMVKNYSEFTLLGETLDDAIGECLDKSSMLMGHDYPGGPVIERLALTGSDVYRLPFPKNDKSLDFSFSGMKSEISKLMMRGKINLNNLSFSIQKRLAEIVIKKLENAFEKFNNSFKTLIVGGGVISNRFLRKRILENIDKKHPLIRVFFPAPGYSTDNAAMIGVLAHYKLKNSIK